MNSLHSMPPPIVLQQGQQGSDVALFQFCHPKARRAYKSGHSRHFHEEEEEGHFCHLHLYKPLQLTNISGLLTQQGFILCETF